jgi:thioredoxin 1
MIAKEKNLLLIIIAILFVLVAAGVYILSDSNKSTTPSDSQMRAEENLVENLDTKEPVTNIEESPISEVATPGSYIAYKETSLTDKKNVIFFAASWCPTCRGLDEAILSELNLIPSDLTILKADYDSETELKRKYGVTYQHTLVQVDGEGNLLKKWNGSVDINDLVSQLI